MLYDSISTKYPEKANLWRQKAHRWMPGAGRGSVEEGKLE